VKLRFIVAVMVTILLCLPAFGQTTDDWYNRVNDLYDQGKYEEAIQAYNKAIEINPNLAGV
jgi:tetratricopeptide (TPR) repeat protein